MHSKPPILLLLGPTATGKTDLALAFAKHLALKGGAFKNTEIISVDSAMVYKGMDIGTGKPSQKELAETPHHLIDIRDPSVPYSAAEFARDALHCIQEIRARNHIPLLVGGSMLYFRALLQGLSLLPAADQNIRRKLLEEAERLGWKALHDRLSTIDPEASKEIHPNDPQRIQRALEIYQLTGQTRSELWGSQPSSEFATETTETTPSLWEWAKTMESSEGKAVNIFVFIILPSDRAQLHERIEQRFLKMIDQGFMKEVECLYDRLQNGELQFNLPALRSVGYRQALECLALTYDPAEMVKRAIAATRQLAKRQITWIRSLTNPENPQSALNSRNQKDSVQIHFLDLKNNHLDSLKSMIHCVL